MDNDIIVSWVIFAMRVALGLDDTRRMILQNEIGSTVEVGKTFGSENTESDLMAYLRKIILKKRGQKRLVLFTAINTPDPDMETHYQSFIIDRKTKTLHMIDPARTSRGQGIYSAYITENTISPFFRSHGYSTIWVRTSHACQTTPHDVFCQTWTIILQIHAVNNILADTPDAIIRIPASQLSRYQIIVDFYRHCVSDIKGVCQELITEYSDSVLHHPNITDGVRGKKQRAIIRMRLLSVDPCEIVKNLTAKDLAA